eukprot:TRINITY_DN274_c1_g1_i1.p1 TRINITY_DN274_c1_g1~~TRINITY_DN274_c1_g1_i1.p1  ORF type:complete len:796 (-),score=265.08 TRINITY_DN274_c1_g1_i1:199-2586(-)
MMSEQQRRNPPSYEDLDLQPPSYSAAAELLAALPEVSSEEPKLPDLSGSYYGDHSGSVKSMDEKIRNILSSFHPETQNGLGMSYDEAVKRVQMQESLPAPMPPSSGQLVVPLENLSAIGWNGDISRAEAEAKLDSCPAGTFLVRWSSAMQSYVLSYVKQGRLFVHAGNMRPDAIGTARITVENEDGTKYHCESIGQYIDTLRMKGVITHPLSSNIPVQPQPPVPPPQPPMALHQSAPLYSSYSTQQQHQQQQHSVDLLLSSPIGSRPATGPVQSAYNPFTSAPVAPPAPAAQPLPSAGLYPTVPPVAPPAAASSAAQPSLMTFDVLAPMREMQKQAEPHSLASSSPVSHQQSSTASAYASPASSTSSAFVPASSAMSAYAPTTPAAPAAAAVPQSPRTATTSAPAASQSQLEAHAALLQNFMTKVEGNFRHVLTQLETVEGRLASLEAATAEIRARQRAEAATAAQLAAAQAAVSQQQQRDLQEAQQRQQLEALQEQQRLLQIQQKAQQMALQEAQQHAQREAAQAKADLEMARALQQQFDGEARAPQPPKKDEPLYPPTTYPGAYPQPGHPTPPSKAVEAQPDKLGEMMGDCPICTLRVKIIDMDHHVDQCLRQSDPNYVPPAPNNAAKGAVITPGSQAAAPAEKKPSGFLSMFKRKESDPPPVSGAQSTIRLDPKKKEETFEQSPPASTMPKAAAAPANKSLTSSSSSQPQPQPQLYPVQPYMNPATPQQPFPSPPYPPMAYPGYPGMLAGYPPQMVPQGYYYSMVPPGMEPNPPQMGTQPQAQLSPPPQQKK